MTLLAALSEHTNGRNHPDALVPAHHDPDQMSKIYYAMHVVICVMRDELYA